MDEQEKMTDEDIVRWLEKFDAQWDYVMEHYGCTHPAPKGLFE